MKKLTKTFTLLIGTLIPLALCNYVCIKTPKNNYLKGNTTSGYTISIAILEDSSTQNLVSTIYGNKISLEGNFLEGDTSTIFTLPSNGYIQNTYSDVIYGGNAINGLTSIELEISHGSEVMIEYGFTSELSLDNTLYYNNPTPLYCVDGANKYKVDFDDNPSYFKLSNLASEEAIVKSMKIHYTCVANENPPSLYTPFRQFSLVASTSGDTYSYSKGTFLEDDNILSLAPTYLGKSITNIKENFLSGSSDIERKINIPASITNIDINAFKQYQGTLVFDVSGSSTTFSSGNGIYGKYCLVSKGSAGTTKLVSIKNNTLVNTNSLDKFHSDIDIIPTGVFDNTDLTNLDLGSSVTSIKEYAISGTSLESIVIRNSVTDIESSAISGVSNAEVFVEFASKADAGWTNSNIISGFKKLYWYSETDKEDINSKQGYWRWVDGVPTPWH